MNVIKLDRVLLQNFRFTAQQNEFFETIFIIFDQKRFKPSVRKVMFAEKEQF